MDIKASTIVLSPDVQTDGRAGAIESDATAKRANDSTVERKEAERAEAGPGVGKRVDVDA